MKNRFVLLLLLAFCVIVFTQQAWPANVDTSAAYMTVFGRPATQVEIDYWKNRLPATQDELVEININWLVSPSGAKDLKETVVRGFQQVFQRAPTASEQQDWENKIKTSRLKYQDFTKALALNQTALSIMPGVAKTMSEMEIPLSVKTSCSGESATLEICSGTVSTPCTQIRYSCFPFECDEKGKTCRSACNVDTDCAPGTKCNLANSQCAVVTYACKDAFTIESGNGQQTSCLPYRCISGQCTENCDKDSGCSEGYKCVCRDCVKQ
jgi:hypothetical protein